MRLFAAVLLLGAASLADDPVPALLVRLESARPEERVLAARALGRIDDVRAVDAVRRVQADESSDVRHEVAVALAKAAKADATTVEILARSLGSDDRYVRWQACLALGSIGKLAEPAVPALVDTLADGTLDVSREAALALAAVAAADQRTIAALIAAIEDGKRDRAAIFHATGTCGPAAKDVVPLLLRHIKNPEARGREEAFDALGDVAPGSAAPWSALLDAEDPVAREYGVRGLRGLKIEDAGSALRASRA